MKKGFFTIVLVGAVFSLAQAQTEKGRWLVGTQVGGGTYQDQNQTQAFSINVMPSAGYFVAKNLLIGAGLPFSVSTSRSYRFFYPDPTFTQARTTSTQLGLAPFAQYYIGSGKLKPYVGIAYTYGQANQRTKAASATVTSQNGIYHILAPTVGVAYFINRNVALNAGLRYDIRRDKTDYLASSGPTGIAQSGTYRSTSTSFDLSIGFQILFGK